MTGSRRTVHEGTASAKKENNAVQASCLEVLARCFSGNDNVPLVMETNERELKEKRCLESYVRSWSTSFTRKTLFVKLYVSARKTFKCLGFHIGQLLATRGPSAFYRGPVAEAIVDAVAAAGGVMSMQDLEDHLSSSAPSIGEPISTTYRAVTVHTMPPPSHGAILLEALNILEGFDLRGTCKM